MAIGCGGLIGCGTSDSSLLPSITQQAQSNPLLAAATATPAGSTETSTASTGPIEFPYAERSNPFATEELPEPEIAPRTAVRDVKVLGFVRVDEPRVLLRIGDQAQTLAVGEAFLGIEVTTIEPPIVRLRQGNLQWNASLFEPARP